jgi:hypothetical protein
LSDAAAYDDDDEAEEEEEVVATRRYSGFCSGSRIGSIGRRRKRTQLSEELFACLKKQILSGSSFFLA